MTGEEYMVTLCRLFSIQSVLRTGCGITGWDDFCARPHTLQF